MNYNYITTDDALVTCCERARQCTEIALDTEFVRTRTYYPLPGLIQIYDDKQISLLDPLTISEWKPFIDLLQDDKVIKFLHSGGEDLVLFLHSFGVLPKPMIDTQILAAFTGKSLSSGFAPLVEELTGEILDKSETRTDWLARPLSDRQCSYAAADVFWLLPIARRLMDHVNLVGKMGAAKEECELLCQRRVKEITPDQAYRELARASLLSQRQLATLKLLAAWRLTLAREENIAVNFVVREEHLWKIARYQPSYLGELTQLGLTSPEIRSYGKILLDIVKQAKTMSDADLPPPFSNICDYPGYKKIFKALKGEAKNLSEITGLSADLLASRRQIHQLLKWHWGVSQPTAPIPDLMTGWRHELMKAAIDKILTQN